MKTNPSPSSLDLTTPAAAFAYLETIDSPTVEIAGFSDHLSPVDDAIRAITGESSNSFALSHNCWMWSTPELIRVLAEYLPSTPLHLCPPTGVRGSYVEHVATYITARCLVALEVKKHTSNDGHVSYSYTGKHGAGSGHGLEHVKGTIRVMLATHKGVKLNSGVDLLAPASPVKDTPAKGLDIPMRHCACGTPFDATGTCPACYSDDDFCVRPELDALEHAPASPVESVGVPDWKIHSVHSHVIVRTADVNGGNVHVATFSNEDDAKIAVQAVSSHAAKDAKIKALTDALKAFTGHQIFCSEGDDTAPKYRCRCHACTSVRSAERALALPSA